MQDFESECSGESRSDRDLARAPDSDVAPAGHGGPPSPASLNLKQVDSEGVSRRLLHCATWTVTLSVRLVTPRRFAKIVRSVELQVNLARTRAAAIMMITQEMACSGTVKLRKFFIARPA